MKHKLNPVFIGGYDVLYIGRKGFSSLAKATKALIRPKGASKDVPWTILSFKGVRTNKGKDRRLTKTIIQLTKTRDEETEKKVRAPKQKAKKIPRSSQIKFMNEGFTDKLIKTRDGENLTTRKYYFHTAKSYEFVEARDMSLNTIHTYVKAVKQEFLNEVFSEFGKNTYLLRLYHDYKNLESNNTIDPLNKGFSGLGLNRQEMNREDVDEQFGIMEEVYLDAFSKYLQYARSDTYFRFTGFTAEVVLKAHPEMEREVPMITKVRRPRKSKTLKKKTVKVKTKAVVKPKAKPKKAKAKPKAKKKSKAKVKKTKKKKSRR